MEINEALEKVQYIEPEYLRLFSIIKTATVNTLYQVLLWGCPKHPLMTLEDYMQNNGMTKRQYKKYFNASMRNKLQEFPEREDFDIPLLVNTIKFACSNVAVFTDHSWNNSEELQLENSVTLIEEFWQQFLDLEKQVDDECHAGKIEELKVLLKNLLTAAIRRYYIKFNFLEEETSKIALSLDHFEDANTEKWKMEYRDNRITKAIARSARKEIVETYSPFTWVEPLPLMDNRPEVVDVFTNIEISWHEKQFTKKTLNLRNLLLLADNAVNRITYRNIKNQGREEKKEPVPVIILLGEEGSGKSTIMKQIICEWSLGGTFFESLHEYDIILYADYTSSALDFKKLCLRSMPNTVDVVGMANINKVVENLRLLLLLDSVNHAGPLAQLMEQFDSSPQHDLTIVISTVHKNFTCSGFHFPIKSFKIRILGIPENDIEDCIVKYVRHLEPTFDDSDIDNVLEAYKDLEQRVVSLLRFPCHLSVFTALAIYNIDAALEVVSLTDLYSKTHDCCLGKLIALSSTEEDREEVKLKCLKVMRIFYEEALSNRNSHEIYVSLQSCKRLKDACNYEGINYDILEAIFFCKYKLPFREMSETVFYHRGMQSFYCAKAIFQSIFQRNIDDLNKVSNQVLMTTLPYDIKQKILLTLEESKKFQFKPSIQYLLKQPEVEKFVIFSNYMTHKIITFLIGFLPLSEKEILHENASLILDSVQRFGFDQSQWIDFLAEVRNETFIVKYVVGIWNQFICQIDDNNITQWAVVFKYFTPYKAEIRILRDPCYIRNFQEFVLALSYQHCKVSMRLYNHWKNENESDSSSDHFLLHLLEGRCTTQDFWGTVNTEDIMSYVWMLKETRLYLCFLNSYTANLFFDHCRGTGIKRVALHLIKDIDPEYLYPSTIPVTSLYLSDVNDDDIEWAANMAMKVQRQASWAYYELSFPRSQLTNVGVRSLLENDIRIDSPNGIIKVNSPNITDEEEHELQQAAMRRFNCKFLLINSDDIWEESPRDLHR